MTTTTHGPNLEAYVEETLKKFRDYPESDPYKKISWGLFDYMHSILKTHGTDGILKLETDERRKELSDQTWMGAAEHIARHYLNMSEEDIRQAKERKTALGESYFDQTMEIYVGIPRQQFFEQFFQGKSSLSTQDMLQMYQRLQSSHSNAVLGQYVQSRITTKDHADAVARYMQQAKAANPDDWKDIHIPNTYGDARAAHQAIYTHAEKLKGYRAGHHP